MTNQALTVPQFRQNMEKMRPELKKALPEHVTTERFERVTMTAIQQNQDLLQTDPQSLFQAVTQCASDGLLPDGREAALTRFKNKAAYMPMVTGLLKLARQSGELSSMTGHVVYTGDQFDYWIDDEGEHLHHRPALDAEPGQVRAVYAMAKGTDGSAYIEVMRVAEVEKVRQSSQSPNKGPWNDWWDQMAIKTAIRRLFKRLPKSTDRFDDAVQRDDQLYSLDRGAAPESPGQGVPELKSAPQPEPQPAQPAAQPAEPEPQPEPAAEPAKPAEPEAPAGEPAAETPTMPAEPAEPEQPAEQAGQGGVEDAELEGEAEQPGGDQPAEDGKGDQPSADEEPADAGQPQGGQSGGSRDPLF